MKTNITILIIIGLFISGCVNPPLTNLPNAYIFDKTLKDDYENLKHSLNRKRIAIKFTNGTTVNNCIDYLTQIKISEISDGVNNKIHHNEYLTCEALDLVKSHNITPLAKDQFYGRKLSDNLILTSYPSSINQESEVYGETLQKLDPTNLKIGDYFVIRETDDWTYSLRIVASADLNNDNIDDLIIWLYDQAKDGNYHAYSTLIVPLYNNNQPLVATPYEKWGP